MPRVSGDGFSVNTDSLRDDATKWTDQTGKGGSGELVRDEGGREH